jgi:hypothetical protein
MIPMTTQAAIASEQMRRTREQPVVSPEEQVGFVIGDAESRELPVRVKLFCEGLRFQSSVNTDS